MTIKRSGRGFAVYGKKTGKRLTKTYKSRKAALHREKQIQYFVNDKKYFKDHGRHIPIRRRKR